jgi:drug/metabolite transporter (DMT)-like permease
MIGAMRSRWRDVALVVGLGVGWGSTQPLGKIAASTGHPPLALLFWQTVIVVLVLGAISLVRGRGLVLTRRAWAFYGIVAVLGTVVPNTTFYISVARLPAGIMSIIISMIPMIAFPMGLALGMDRFEARRLAGLALGLLGVALIALPRTSLPDPAMVAWLPLALVGPLFYATEATFVARFGTAGMDPVQAMFGTSIVALALVAPLMLASGQWVSPLPPWGRAEAALVISSAAHGVLYAAYVGLAARVGAVFAAQSSYVTTAAGVIWAMVLLGERFSPLVWLAAAVMLAGIALVRPRPAQAVVAALPGDAAVGQKLA